MKFLNGCQNNFAYVENEKNPKVLPTLTKFSYDVEIFDSIAQIKTTQEYLNYTEELIEITYSFSKSSKSVLVDVEAQFEGQVLKGIVKDREVANLEYKVKLESA